MIAAELRFPAGGRFHATPWGRHVNEGAVEWPVEPWRLLRALVATWFHKARADVGRETLVRLVTALAGAPPVFHLPSASLGHTRHWMPDAAAYHKQDGKLVWGAHKTKLFDAFIHVADGQSLGIRWDVDLPADERAALGILLERIGYLGRAESLVEARLLADADAPPADAYNTRPLPAADTNGHNPTDGELVQVLAPLSAADYRVWREGYLQGQTTASARGRGRAAGSAPVPATVFDALLADTGALRAAGWSLPPGARHMTYLRPADAFKTRALLPRRLEDPKTRPTVARYAVASAVLPSITAAVSVGDRVHQAIVSRSHQPVFTGQDAAGAPLREQHRHASILSECDGDDRIRFLTVYAPDGFDADARRALSNVKKVWGHGGHDLQLVLLGFGHPADFAGRNAGSGQSPILCEAREWISLTPFVPTRHGKTRANGEPKLDEHGDQIGGPAHDLLRLLRLLLPESEPEIICAESHAPLRRPLRWLQFQRRRPDGEGARAGEFGFGFRLRFAKPVRGPLAVGYGAHFGLGLFVPAPPTSQP